MDQYLQEFGLGWARTYRLGWTGAKHTLVEDLPMWLEQYRAANLDKKEIEEDAAVSAII